MSAKCALRYVAAGTLVTGTGDPLNGIITPAESERARSSSESDSGRAQQYWPTTRLCMVAIWFFYDLCSRWLRHLLSLGQRQPRKSERQSSVLAIGNHLQHNSCRDSLPERRRCFLRHLPPSILASSIQRSRNTPHGREAAAGIDRSFGELCGKSAHAIWIRHPTSTRRSLTPQSQRER